MLIRGSPTLPLWTKIVPFPMVWWFLLKHKVVVDWSINEIKENPAPPFLSSHCIFSCFQGNIQFIMLTWSKKRFGNFKFKPIKHYSSDKRKLDWKKQQHNFDLAKSDFYPPEGHSCEYQNLGTLKWAYYFRSCQKEENFMRLKFGRVLPVIRNIHFYRLVALQAQGLDTP